MHDRGLFVCAFPPHCMDDHDSGDDDYTEQTRQWTIDLGCPDPDPNLDLDPVCCTICTHHYSLPHFLYILECI